MIRLYDAIWAFDMIKIQSNYAWEQIISKENVCRKYYAW